MRFVILLQRGLSDCTAAAFTLIQSSVILSCVRDVRLKVVQQFVNVTSLAMIPMNTLTASCSNHDDAAKKQGKDTVSTESREHEANVEFVYGRWLQEVEEQLDKSDVQYCSFRCHAHAKMLLYCTSHRGQK